MKKTAVPPRVDILLVLITAILVVCGTFMVFSSSVIMADVRWQTPYVFVIKHILWVIIGVAVAYYLSRVNYHYFQEHAKFLIIIAIALLAMVLLFGTVKGGARRWLHFGPLSFQPSELAKLVLVIGLADYLDRKKSKLKNFAGLLPALGLTAVLCVLVGLEPDLGTPVIMVSAAFSLLYVAGARIPHLLMLVAGVIPFGILEILRKPYRLHRVMDFLNSWGDIQSPSYQVNQSILALGSGGFLGKGLGQSQMKMLFLPEPHTDFIFPIIGEEMGFIGTILLIALFLLFAWRGWTISRRSQDLFGGMLALGLTWLIIFQALLNIGVACGFFPTKGLPLPFVSFGGTALVLNLASVGILVNISQHRGSKK